MNPSFVAHYVGALALTAALLAAIFYAARGAARMRVRFAQRERIVQVVESTPLSGGTMVYVLRLGENSYLVGGGNGRLTLLDKIAPGLRPEAAKNT
ncbi:MAG: flagellar biosynthetic protein FliO [Candidatus Eremiobacteraeota bacterium]|nr:flagellar biosynthetic protein FliO [Candidatus Eremiobacteraeota bacterium]